MTRHTWLKLFRYGVLFPLDVLRALPACIVAVIAAPARPFISHTTSARLTARIVFVLFLWRWPEPALLDAFARLVERARIGIYRTVLGFFQWPASLEANVLGCSALLAHHRARLHLVQTVLPSGGIILDIGGSTGGVPEGGLLHMGYPYTPEKVTIVDLPPEKQFWKHIAPAAKTYTYGTTQVQYHYSGMADLSAFAANSIDGVWGGQCIEHVPHEVALATMDEVFRVLKPGGWFCLDTPNRYLTHSLIRVGLIHPEHFVEYFPEQLIGHLCSAGFDIRSKRAVSAMPFSRRVDRFWKYEVEFGELLSDAPDVGFSFYVEARKSAALSPQVIGEGPSEGQRNSYV